MSGALRPRRENWLIAAIAALGLLAAAAQSLLRVETSSKAPAEEQTILPQDQTFETMDPAARASLPLIQLMLSKKDVGHLDLLYAHLSDEAYYLANNQWRKAQLKYDGRDYDVRIKSHGRQPTGHSVERYISLSVKMGPGDLVEGMNEFKLIIRERLSQNNQLVMAMAKEADLLSQGHDLVRVRINNWPEKLFYFSNRLDDKYFEAIGKSSLRAMSYDDPDSSDSDKSMVYTNPDPAAVYDAEAFRQRFELALAQAEYPPEQWEPITERFSDFNAAIAGSRWIDPIEFFDLDYIKRFEIVRYVLGLIGHGFMGGNLRVVLDTANGKFYPALSRDNIPFVLDLSGKRTPELQLDTWPDYGDGNARAIPIFHYLAHSDRIRGEVYKGLYEFITQQEERVAAEHRRLLDEFASMDAGGRELLEQRRRSLAEHGEVVPPEDVSIYDGIFKNITQMNLDSLRTYLESSDPEYSAVQEHGALVLNIQPNSMSELGITKLAIGLHGSPRSFEMPVRLKIVAFTAGHADPGIQLSRRIPTNGSTLDLSSLLGAARFSTSLGSPRQRNTRYQPVELERTPRRYRLEFAFGGQPVPFPDLDRIDLKLVSTVTGRQITPRRIEPRDQGDEGDSPGPHATPPPTDTLAEWKQNNRGLGIRQRGPSELTLSRGTHLIEHNLIFPDGYRVTIQRGTELRLGAGVVVLVRGGLTIVGSENSPVRIRPIDSDRPFGSVAVVGNGSNETRIRYLELSGGSEGWVDGTHFSGALSLHYQHRVQISRVRISNSHADDGLNIKYATGTVTDSVFAGNQMDQLDLDYFDGVVARSAFTNDDGGNANGDGLDISGSRVLVVDNEFGGFIDKGTSVGERSAVFFYRNQFRQNLMGVAVKDSSDAYFLENRFRANRYDISAYLKKRIFGGGRVFLIDDPNNETPPTVDLDNRSSVAQLPRAGIARLLPSDVDTADAGELLAQLSNLAHVQ